MPYAATHLLSGIIASDVIRDYAVKDRKSFPRKLVLLCGIFSLLPDIDIVAYYIGHLLFGIQRSAIHRIYTHTFMLPVLLLLATVVLYKTGNRKAWKIMALASLGTFLHISLDFLICGYVNLYPFSSAPLGLALVPAGEFGAAVLQGIDAAILVSWLVYEETKHKIRDYI